MRRALWGISVVGLALWGAGDRSYGAQDRRVVDIVAERFSFYPSNVVVTAGAVLELRIRSEDTLHGFRIVGTDLDVSVPKRGRGEAVVRFQADEPGEYRFECSKLCGAGHSFMQGTIRVEADRSRP